MTRAHIPAQTPALRNREFLGRRPGRRRTAAPGAGQFAAQSGTPLRDSTQLALVAFTRQVLLRPARIGTLVGLGGMIAIVVVRGSEWWILLGVLLFQVAAAALTAMWVDVGHAARSRRPAGPPPAPPAPWDDRYLPLPRQRRPHHDR